MNAKFGSPPYPAHALHLAQHFAWSESFALPSWSGLRCRTLGRSRPQLAGLVTQLGKALDSNITVPLGLVVPPKALAMARFWLVASPLKILASCLSQFRPLLPYYYNPLPGWHPTGHHQLASPLLGGSARLSILSDRRTPPRSRPVPVLHCLRGCCQPLGATDVITGAVVAFWFRIGPLFQDFAFMRDHHPLPRAPKGP